MLDGKPWFKKTTREIKIVKLLTVRGGSTWHASRVPEWELGDQGKVQGERELQDLGHMPLLGSVGGVLWDSQARARLVSSNPKQQSFGKLFWGLF